MGFFRDEYFCKLTNINQKLVKNLCNDNKSHLYENVYYEASKNNESVKIKLKEDNKIIGEINKSDMTDFFQLYFNPDTARIIIKPVISEDIKIEYSVFFYIEELKKKKEMKWFNFFGKVYFIWIIIINCIYVSNFINNYSDTRVMANLVLVFINIFAIIIPSLVLIDKYKKKSKDYTKLLLIWLSFTFILSIISNILFNNNRDSAYITGTVLGAALWYIPNMIYFYKRFDTFKYEDNEIETKKEKLTKKTEPKELTKKSFCTSCGKEIDSQWNYCNYCGSKLK